MNIAAFQRELLDWYDANARELPWRAPPGEPLADPYHVWLSEIMLQQTTVPAVIPYFLKFLELWPSVQDLAAAEQEDVMREWAGLGYYARARNLHKCAKMVVEEHEGMFPQEQQELQKLPGIGEYTSGAISAIAFGQNASVVDGNVERVLARVHAVGEPLPTAKKQLKALAAAYFEEGARPGDLAQAFMDLGSSVCTAKSPSCLLCPIRSFCEASSRNIAELLPKKEKKKPKPHKYGAVYWILNGKNQVLTEMRGEKGMLAGMRGLPTSDWIENKNNNSKLRQFSKVKTQEIKGFVTHSFTHFDLTLRIVTGHVHPDFTLEKHQKWVNLDEVASVGFPTLFKKVLKFTLTS